MITQGELIAWANDLGVKIYDLTSKQRITFIARDHSPDLRPELYRCNLCWKDDTTLLIGWGDTVKGEFLTVFHELLIKTAFYFLQTRTMSMK